MTVLEPKMEVYASELLLPFYKIRADLAEKHYTPVTYAAAYDAVGEYIAAVRELIGKKKNPEGETLWNSTN